MKSLIQILLLSQFIVNYSFSQINLDHIDFDINKLMIVLANNGKLGAYDAGIGLEDGQFEESKFLHSGGFLMSGFTKDSLFANGNFATSRYLNYIPGTVGSSGDDQQFKFYVVRSADEPFSQSWTGWEGAVANGAEFYDGDGDNIFNPVDINGNGIWDENEDRPDFLGDMTAWSVFSDNGPLEWRSEDLQRFAPAGIEIKQTIFAWKREIGNPLNNIIFFRYVIEHKGLLSDTLKNILFGIAADPDLGDYNDDLVGCIPNRNLGYAYNSGEDDFYGGNPPSFGMLLLKGPEVYKPGESFVDNNGNRVYDAGTDTPLLNAEFNRGPFLGSEKLEGAVNLNISAFVHGMSGSPKLGDPDHTREELYNYLQAKDRDGSEFSVANWIWGNGYELGEAADSIPFHFMFSGDPVAGTGWLDNFTADSRTTLTVGPFDLVKGETKEIVYAYVVGRGTDALNSITEMKEIADAAQKFYDSNFTDLPVSFENETNNYPDNFQLDQNYPNPFNPTTKIKYTISTSPFLPPIGKGRDGVGLFVTLKILDTLGREVQTLVNNIQQPGSYEVQFDASGLSSGVYFYELRVNDFHAVKKMTVLK